MVENVWTVLQPIPCEYQGMTVKFLESQKLYMDSNYVCGGLGSPNPNIDQGSTVVKKRHEKIAPSPATLPKGQSVHEAQEECKLKKENKIMYYLKSKLKKVF